jgi:3',5'-cyclic AMP phosphodiesterase CpdA
MRTLLHLSDPHFGRIDEEVIEPLLRAARELAPDITVVSGDLTQRARRWQFLEARRFLDQLPGVLFVVPGNHDVPLHNPLARFFAPLRGYRTYINANVEPFYKDSEVVLTGVNSSRSLTIKDGRLGRKQIERLRARLCDLPPELVKIVVCHHPFELPPGAERESVISGARDIIGAIATCQADMVLSGHFHVGHCVSSAARYSQAGRSILLIQAGTATSSRRRHNTPSAFNHLRIDRTLLELTGYSRRDAQTCFQPEPVQRFRHDQTGWVAIESQDPSAVHAANHCNPGPDSSN